MEPGLVPAGAIDLPIGVDQQSGRLPTSTQQSAAFPHALPDCLPLHTLSSVLTRSVVYTNLRNVTEVASVASVTVASFQRAIESRDAGSVLRARIVRLTHVH